MVQSLEKLRFDNRFLRELPGDLIESNYCRQVEHACYSRVIPAKVTSPQIVAFSIDVAKMIGLDPEGCDTELFAQVFSGNHLLSGMDPYAMCYGGHQFGHWAGQLGDGRAINLGELLTPSGGHLTLQLKGSGLTPYSRNADGLAVLRSSVREFLCSEAMHHLGVPTTRALSLILTGEEVVRDMLYDGNPRPEPGAIVCRVASSFLRFGSFQIFTARKDKENLKRLVDYCITTDFKHLGAPSQSVYLRWFEEVVNRTASLIAHWMRVGFVHGVMNTDNMSIIGETIDYGPYGWLDNFDPDWTPNTTDSQGRRYRYAHQANVAHWNLAQLGNAVLPIIEDVDSLQSILDSYVEIFAQRKAEMWKGKLGISDYDEELVCELEAILIQVETDMTLFFWHLADLPRHHIGKKNIRSLVKLLEASYYDNNWDNEEYLSRFMGWLQRWKSKLRPDYIDVMRKNNPRYVLRNYMAQVAIDRADQGDMSLIEELLCLLRAPYNIQPEKDKWSGKRPDWARDRVGCSMLSCSS